MLVSIGSDALAPLRIFCRQVAAAELSLALAESILELAIHFVIEGIDIPDRIASTATTATSSNKVNPGLFAPMKVLAFFIPRSTLLA